MARCIPFKRKFLFFQNGIQQMLCPDISHRRLTCGVIGALDDFFAFGRHVRRRQENGHSAPRTFDDGGAYLSHGEPARLEHFRGGTFSLGHETYQQMLGADIGVSEIPGDAERVIEGVLRPFGEFVSHVSALFLKRYRIIPRDS